MKILNRKLEIYEKIICIYVLINKINGMRYVGRTENLYNRIKDHKSNAKNNRKTLIHDAIRDYGWDNFIIKYKEYPAELLYKKEIEYIKRYKTAAPNGYNSTFGGNGGEHFTQEVLDKISKSMKGKYSGKNAYWYGKHHSEETKRKISDHNAMLSGSDHPNAIKVICLETGKVFDCIEYAANKVNVCSSGITACCRGKQKTAGGYHWVYYNNYLKQQKVS